jgi:hypothetical protein
MPLGDIFVATFGNIFTDMFLLIFLLVGIIAGVLFRPWFGNQVIKLIDRERRFIDLDVAEESAVTITCKNKKGIPPQRFVKYAPGYVGSVGTVVRKPITRFFGKEGTAYTWMMKSSGLVKVKLEDALKGLWGEDFYSEIPETQRAMVEESKIGVTIDITEGLTPGGYKSVSEEDIKREEDREAAKTFWQGKNPKGTTQWIIIGLAVGCGVAICAVLFILGVLKIPSSAPAATPTPGPSPGPSVTAGQIVLSIIASMF